ncbi:MAG TPA: efflux transporter outer membrane subunit [Methylibium sp.]|nr:efflux transporter outer membrane subunit [Methylibium sp.]
MLVLMAAALSACAVGPDYQRPAAKLDAGFVNAGATAANAQAVSADIVAFWRGFNDAALTALVERGLAANGDVRIAQARLQEARANLGEADAAARPGLGIDSGITRSVRPITQQPGASRSERTGSVYDASFIANWELDFFGRYRRGSAAAAALVQAGEAGIGAAHTAVAAEVARNYLELRGLQQRQQVTEAALVNQREALRIVQARLDAGRATQLDLARATTLVASTDAALPSLQSAIERSVFRLATLTAQPPRALLAQLAAPAPLPGLPVTDLAMLPLGTPQQWLERRPDVIAAERQLAAATARIGVAKSELFPRISLSGLLGLNAATLGNLGDGDSAIYSLGVGLTWTPFDLGSIRSRIAASEARTEASLASYEQTVLLALEETEGAFSGYSRNAQRAVKLDAAVRASEEAARLARLRYEAGVTDFLAVLDAEREALSNRDQWVQAQTGTATALVAVYRALGGGWTAPAQVASSAR